jgi:hypothetical protein
MPLTARTWVAGEMGTAAKLNTLRDDVSFLHTIPWARATARDASTQAVTTLADLALDTQEEDSASMFASGPEITIPSGGGGWYRCMGRSTVSDNSNPTVAMHLRWSAGADLDTWSYTPGSVTNMGTMTARVFWEGALVAGQSVKLQASASGGGALFGSATSSLASRLIVVGPCPPA